MGVLSLLFCVCALYASLSLAQKPPPEPIMQCDFDEGLCPGWTPNPKEVYQWQVGKGVAKVGTGPKYDYNRANDEGGYIFMDDNGKKSGKAIIRTPRMDLSKEKKYCLRFVFFSRGRSPGELRMFHSNKMTSGVKVSVFFRAGPRSDNNTHWIFEDVTLRSFKSERSFKKVYFDIQVLKGRGTDNIVALDDFSVTAGECPPFQFSKTATTATFAPSPTNELGEAIPTKSPGEVSNEEVVRQNEERIRENEERNRKVQEMNALLNSGQYTPTYDPNQPTQPTQPTQPLQPHDTTATSEPEGSTISEKERQEQILAQQKLLQEEADKRRIAEQDRIAREEIERKEMVEKKMQEREERQRKQKEEEERKIKETQEKQKQWKLSKEKEEKERREKEEQKKKEEQERKMNEKAEREKKMREEHERKKKEHQEKRQKEREDRERKIAEERAKHQKQAEQNLQNNQNNQTQQNQQNQQGQHDENVIKNQQDQQNQQNQQRQQNQQNKQNRRQGGKRRGKGGKGKRGGGKKMAKKDNPNYVKCGKGYIQKKKQLCCAGRPRKITGGNMMCCGRSTYNANNNGCCGGKVFDSTGTNQCCGNSIFDAVTHACCGEEAYDLATDLCVDGEVQPNST